MGCSGSQTSRIHKLTELDSFEDAENTPGVAHLFISEDNLLISGTLTGYLKVYKIENTKLQEKFSEKLHDNAILCLVRLDSKRIISSSMDNSIKIFERTKESSLKIVKAYLSHENSVTQVLPLIDGDHFASCSIDCSIRIFKSKNEYEEVFKIDEVKQVLSMAQIETGVIGSVHMEDQKDENSVVNFWTFNQNKLTKIHTIDASADFRPFFIWNMKPKKFVISCMDHVLILDGTNYNQIKKIEDEWKNPCTSFYQIDNNYAYIAGSGYIYQVLLKDYSFCFKEKMEAMDGESKISTSKDGSIIVTTKNNTLTVLQATFIWD